MRFELTHPRGYLGLSQARLPFRHSGISHFGAPYPRSKAASPFCIVYKLFCFTSEKGYTIHKNRNYRGELSRFLTGLLLIFLRYNVSSNYTSLLVFLTNSANSKKDRMEEPRGLEPLTFSLQGNCAPNCATAPYSAGALVPIIVRGYKGTEGFSLIHPQLSRICDRDFTCKSSRTSRVWPRMRLYFRHAYRCSVRQGSNLHTFRHLVFIEACFATRLRRGTPFTTHLFQ